MSPETVVPDPCGGVTPDSSVPTGGAKGLSPGDETGSTVSSSASASSSPESATTATTVPSPTTITSSTTARAFHETWNPPPVAPGP